MIMNSNDFGTLEMTYGGNTVEMNFLVFMEKFYIMIKKDDKITTGVEAGNGTEATVKIIKSSNEEMVGETATVNIEIMDSESRIKHTYDHFDMVKNNYFAEYDTTLTALRCNLVK